MSRCSRGCGSLIEEGDGHDICLRCLGIQHAEAAFYRDVAVTSSASRFATAVATALPSAAASSLGGMGITVSVNPSADGSQTVHAPSRSSGLPAAPAFLIVNSGYGAPFPGGPPEEDGEEATTFLSAAAAEAEAFLTSRTRGDRDRARSQPFHRWPVGKGRSLPRPNICWAPFGA